MSGMAVTRRWNSTRARAVLVLVPAFLSACASSLEPTLVAFPERPSYAAATIEPITTYQEASATIAAIFRRDLGFPGFTATFAFFADRRAFELALLDSGYEPALARKTSDVMVAVGGHRRVLLNEGALVPMPWPSRVGLLAHELTHTLQYELTGGTRGSSDQWLREGFAEWVAMRVLDRLGAVRIAEYRRRMDDALRASNRSKAPRLNDMATFPQLVGLAARRDLAPYAQAFLAVDALIERHGVPKVLRYFELFRRSEDRLGNFAAAFGEDLDTFEAALNERLWPARRR